MVRTGVHVGGLRQAHLGEGVVDEVGHLAEGVGGVRFHAGCHYAIYYTRPKLD